jgi:ubiquinone/menaquinone biosynthesis C-methylase UbiE
VRDWVAWHEAYDDPSSPVSARLQLVRAHLAGAIDQAPAGPVRLVSLCAGQGHDVIGGVRDHPRRDDVRAVLVEADPENAAVARERAAGAGLGQVEVRLADASRVASFADALPTGVLMLCGIFGNVSEPDIERTIATAATFVIPGGTVIWTRHRRPPDRTPRFRGLFTVAGFEEIAFGSPETAPQIGVGAARFRGTAGAAERIASWPDEPLFAFRPQART